MPEYGMIIPESCPTHGAEASGQTPNPNPTIPKQNGCPYTDTWTYDYQDIFLTWTNVGLLKNVSGNWFNDPMSE